LLEGECKLEHFLPFNTYLIYKLNLHGRKNCWSLLLLLPHKENGGISICGSLHTAWPPASWLSTPLVACSACWHPWSCPAFEIPLCTAQNCDIQYTESLCKASFASTKDYHRRQVNPSLLRRLARKPQREREREREGITYDRFLRRLWTCVSMPISCVGISEAISPPRRERSPLRIVKSKLRPKHSQILSPDWSLLLPSRCKRDNAATSSSSSSRGRTRSIQKNEMKQKPSEKLSRASIEKREKKLPTTSSPHLHATSSLCNQRGCVLGYWCEDHEAWVCFTIMRTCCPHPLTHPPTQ
jgi:hypothetical protein